MKSKNVAITTLAAASAVIIGAAGVMLYREHSRWLTAKEGIDVFRPKLMSSVALDPYPSLSNIVAVSNNVRTLEDDAALLRKEMNAGQVAVEAGMDHLTWLSLLTKRKKDLQSRANIAKIRLPLRFPFGFERYDSGTPPKVSDVKRLELQLKTVEQLCRIMYQSGISEIQTVTRELFEDQVVKAARGTVDGSVVATNEAPLFTSEHFAIGLKAKEAALLDLLNALAASKMFVVVTLVRVTGEPGVELRAMPKAGDEADSGLKPENVGDEALSAKIVTGRGKERPADVLIELDVYGFGSP